ncbi:hypothetical protein B0H19DRAFT_1190057 [Mycena capillaripes]|nr:hypothetical protein B0H19DRAFT_1190057 [Mycena capillaripes]
MVSRSILRWYNKILAIATPISFLLTFTSLFVVILAFRHLSAYILPRFCLPFLITRTPLSSLRCSQIALWSRYRFKTSYHVLLWSICFLELVDVIICAIAWVRIEIEFTVFERYNILAPLICNGLLCATEVYFGDEFRQYMRDLTVLQSAEYFVTADFRSRNTRTSRKFRLPKKMLRSLALFTRPESGYIALPSAEPLEMGVALPISTIHSSSSCHSSADLSESVLHWSRMSTGSHKALWITANDNERCAEIADMVPELLSTGSGYAVGISIVDVSQTHSVFWPLIRGLATVSTEYRVELGIRPPLPMLSYFEGFPLRPAAFKDGGKREVSPWLDDDNNEKIINRLLCSPLKTMYENLSVGSLTSGSTDEENLLPTELPHITLVVHGVWSAKQAEELYETLERLEVGLGDYYKSIRMLIITTPTLLRYVSDSDHAIMKRVCTLYVSDTGSVIYSGKFPSPPMFYESLFLLLLDGINRVGGNEAERIRIKLAELDILSAGELADNDDEMGRSTASIFSRLYKASVARSQILELLSKIQVITRAQINRRLVKDNIKIAEMLQRLLELNSYKQDIPSLPQEYTLAVMNLTNNMLEYGLPANAGFKDPKVFALRARHFLHWLAEYLERLPDELTVSGVVLLNEHPVKHDGFSNVYCGKYKDPDGNQAEVALKVLKIFEDQTDENCCVLNQKFVKEALVWYYLKHRNIVSFLGVDGQTFPNPSRAMVSPWMPLGSVLKYMGEHSPSSPYALQLLNDVLQGLTYLHSENVVHGDLSGRNILIDKDGRACLSDFGLAAFIDLETSIKSSTRSGSTRWMAPELLLAPPSGFRRTPASDVWAFGCVCCEIWSEGIAPFSHFGTDMGVIFETGRQDSPYSARPHDKGAKAMPDHLWELAQWCFQYEPSGRPTVQKLTDLFTEMMEGYGFGFRGLEDE